MKFLMAGASAFAIVASTAFAADPPMMVEESYDPPASLTWTSFYVGGQVGGIFGLPGVGNGCGNLSDFDVDPITPLRGTLAALPYDYSDDEIGSIECWSSSSGDSSTWGGGLFVGADVQYGSFVLGAVLDFNWLDDDGRWSWFGFDPDSGVAGSGPYDDVELPGAISWNGSALADPGDDAAEVGTPYQEYWQEEILDWYGTGRVRAGAALGSEGRVLVYGTGGVAYGKVTRNASWTATYTPDEADRVFDTPAGADSLDGEYTSATESYALPSNCSDYGPFGADSQIATVCTSDTSDSEYRVGYTLGAGLEYLATENFSVGVEGLYVNLGTGGDLWSDMTSISGNDLDFWSIMVRGSLRFGGGHG